MKKFWLTLLIGLLVSGNVQSAERILSFHSDITVQKDGRLDVVETITVRSERKSIKRGIYRELPDSYDHPEYGRFGLKTKTPLEIYGVDRDGQREPYHTERLSNGTRTYFGSSERFLKSGEYTYTFRYSMQRQIARTEAGAQLYWNVTGNDWEFPIDRATARVTLPETARINQYEAWTGPQGSTRSDARFEGLSDNRISLVAERQLRPSEGMTLRVFFTADVMSWSQESEWDKVYQDNVRFIWGWLMLLMMLAFYTVMWVLKGIDPAKGVIVAQYRPLSYLSAAAHRAVYRNLVDNTSFAVGVLSAAIKGWLTIEEVRSGVFKLIKNKQQPDSKLSPGEQLLVDGLFKKSSSVTFGDQYDGHVHQVKKSYEKKLRTEYADRAHVNHAISLIAGAMIGLVGLVMIFYDYAQLIAAPVFFLVFIGIFAGAIVFNALNKVPLWKWLIFSLSIVALALYLAYSKGVLFAAPMFFFAIVFAMFSYLMPAPKVAGRMMMDKIEGFRLYLSKAEHDSLQRLTLPEKTPQLYEELLPFAIALDLETHWSGQFVDVLAKARQQGDKGHHYHSWYHGDNRFSAADSLAPALAAGLASSVVAASTPPSSSSSSGGSSGGGGGGGGGGGW
ncbi:MAG: DUF2207 domain-containing protein [Arenicella sp.]